MYIKSIKAPGFEGSDVNLMLSQSNVIVGQPFTGKTSIANAIIVGMYGYLSRLGTSNQSTLQLSSESDLFVRLTFDNDKQNTVSINNASGKTSLGAMLDVKFPEVLMDLEEYFGRTGQKRLQYVLDRVNLKKAGYDEKTLLEEMRECDKTEDGGPTALTDKTIKERNQTKASISIWMESLLSRLKASEKALKDAIKIKEKTISDFKKMEEPEDHSEAMGDAHGRLVTAQANLQGESRPSFESEIEGYERDISSLRSQYNDLEMERMKMAKLDCCPTCKSSGDAWLAPWNRANSKKMEEISGKIDDLNAKIKQEEKKLADYENSSDKKRRDSLRRECEEAQEEYDRLDDLQRERITWESDRDDAKKAEKDLKVLQVEIQSVKAMIDVLVRHQEDIAEKAFTSLLKTAQLFTNQILRSSVVYRDGEFGRWEKKRWVSHEVFSGTEKLLAYSGLQVALCQEAECKIIIADELGRMPGEWREKFAARMIELVRLGHIDQWIGIDSNASFWDKECSAALKKKINLIHL